MNLLRTLSLLTLLSLPTLTLADPPKTRDAFDPATGRNLLNFPPHRWADIRHTRLILRIPSMNDRTILASATHTIAPISGDLSSFTLHSALLQINSVTAPGRTCTFTRDEAEETLTITLDPPLTKSQTTDITINYRIVDPPEGLTWTPESPAHPGRAAQIHSQGQSESNRYWFPCHDFPNARATTEIIATVPRGYQVLSNGRLASSGPERLEPFDTFHWVQDKSHPAYLVTLVVGKFDIVDVGAGGSKLPMPVYVPPGQGVNVRRTFGRTPKMVDLLARLSGEPYPWAKYAQVCVHNFAWGGMENTSATTLYDTVVLDKTALLDGDQDDLIVHELGHQWYGDLLTCKSWEHLWLNEGFATYCEALWEQYKGSSIPSAALGGRGTEGLRPNDAAYDAVIYKWIHDVASNDTGEAPYQPAMASKEYFFPDDAFDRAANPYPKGALVLHMLRARLGDDVFFRGLSDYTRAHKFQSVETFQFRQALEKAGGVSLQRFFDQWVFRPGVPKIKVTPSWDDTARTLTVNFEQTQIIDGYNPAFDLAIPLWLKSPGDTSWRKQVARFDERKGAIVLPLASKPDTILIDPDLTVLAKFDIALSESEWIAQAKSAPPPPSHPATGARFRAIEALGKSGGTESAAAALAAILRDESALRDLRIASAKSLESLGAPGTPLLTRALNDARIADARVRAALIEHAAAAAKADPAPITARLTALFKSDPSYAVRAAAIKALGTLKSDSAPLVIADALNTNSQHDQIRKAAIAALKSLDTPDALRLVLARTAPDNSSSLRAAATESLGHLAHHDPDRTFTALAALLNDREPRTVQAASKALTTIGGPRVRTLLENRIESVLGRSAKASSRKWLRELPADKPPQPADSAQAVTP